MVLIGRGKSSRSNFLAIFAENMFAIMGNAPSRSVLFSAKQLKTLSVILRSYSGGEQRSYRLVVVGGGTAGCAIASKFGSYFGKGRVAVVEPSDVSLPLCSYLLSN